MKLSRLTSIAFILSAVIATLAHGQMGSQEPSIVGTWRVVHIESAGPDDGSATREKLVGKSETLHYDLPDNRHMIIRPT